MLLLDRIVRGRLVGRERELARANALWQRVVAGEAHALLVSKVRPWDRGEPWLSTLRHIAKEGRVHVVGRTIALRKDDIPDRFEFKAQYYFVDKKNFLHYNS